MKHNRTEKDWSSIYDAQTLAAAELIKADTKRYERAVEWAEKLVKEEQAEAKAMQDVANG